MTTLEHLTSGTIIDNKYRLDRSIGVGGMGAVYYATQIDLGRKVAIKLLHPHFRHDPGVTERFQREAKLAASIGHDNICEVTDFGTTDEGAPYLVMPVLKGRAFSAVLKDEPMPIPRICDIMGQVLSALDAAHVAGVVHRDLKPDNIFISKIGDRNDFVKLLDFGISKVMESGAMKELTRTGTVMGTPVYMAPEQAKGEKNVDHRLDIYAAGVILYEALTGKRPHDGDSYNEIVFKIIAEPYPPPRQLNADIPKKLERVIVKAMTKEPAGRYASAKEMAEALKKAVETTLVGPATMPATTQGRVVPQAPPEQRSSKRVLIPVLVVLIIIIAAGVVAAVIFKRGAETSAYTALLPPSGGTALNSATSLPPTEKRGDNSEHKDSVMIPMSNNDAMNVEDPPGKSPTGLSKKEISGGAQAIDKKQPHVEKKKSSSPTSPQIPGVPEGKELPSTPSPSGADLALSLDSTLPSATSAVSGGNTGGSLSSATPKRYTHMNQLKTALRNGEITRAEYSRHQEEIRKNREIEFGRAKQDLAAGRISKAQYNQRIADIKHKYETGAEINRAVPPAPPAPSGSSASSPASFNNMKKLKNALSEGRITREQYRTHQQNIRNKRAAEYDQIKADYRAGKIDRNTYNRLIEQTRQKYEGN